MSNDTELTALIYLIEIKGHDAIPELQKYIAQEANKARIDERKRFDDEIDDVLTRHSKNPDLSPLAELRDYNYNAISSLTADKEQKLQQTNDGGKDE